MALEAEHRIDVITKEAFADLLKQYPDIIPVKSLEHEPFRYIHFPQNVAARRQDGKAELSKTEVVTLVDWKLSHGTFRPKLKQLVQSNAPDAVQKMTAGAFASFDGSAEKAKSCLAELSSLKGIGPATASLLLSVAFPDTAPFFSDELFRWTFWEEGKGKGWDRPIKYTPKEYLELFNKVQEMRGKHEWAAVDMEKTAFVLGHRSTGKGISRALDTQLTVIDQAKDKKRVGLDVEATSPRPSKKAKREPAASATHDAKHPARETAGAPEASKTQSAPQTRSSLRLKNKAS